MGRKPKWHEYQFDSQFFYGKYYNYGNQFYLSPYIPKKDTLSEIALNEKNPIETIMELDSKNSELISLLKYISCVQISYKKLISATREQNYNACDLTKPLSFNYCNKIYENILFILKQELNALDTSTYTLYPHYPLKHYNLFFEPKHLSNIFKKVNKNELDTCQIVTNNLEKIFTHMGLSELFKDLFNDNSSNDSISHSIPKCSFISLVFLIQTYRNKKYIPKYLQYIIYSDAIINIMIAKEKELSDIFSTIIQLKQSLMQHATESIVPQPLLDNTKPSGKHDEFDISISEDYQILRNHFYLEYANLLEKHLNLCKDLKTFRLMEKYTHETKGWADASNSTALEKHNAKIKSFNNSAQNSPNNEDIKYFEINQVTKNDILKQFIDYFDLQPENRYISSKNAFDNIYYAHTANIYEMIDTMRVISLSDDVAYKYYPCYFEKFFDLY